MMHCVSEYVFTIQVTVNLEIFAIILFSWIALKDIFATFKIRDLDMIYLC